MRTTIIICIGLFFVLPAFAQEAKVEKWKAIVSQGKKDTATLKAIDSLARWYGYGLSDSGLFYVNEMKQLAESLNSKWYIIFALKQKADMYFTKGKTAEALKDQYTALRLSEELNDSNVLSTTYATIGNSHKEYGDYAKALLFYNKAYFIAKASNQKIALEIATLNLGYAYAELNLLDSALYFEQQAYSLATQRKGTGLLPGIEASLGNIQFKMGNYAIAKGYYESSLGRLLLLRTANLGNRPMVWSYMGLANCFKTMQKVDSAIQSSKLALQVSKKLSYLKGIRDANQLLAELFDSKNQIDSAYYYHKIAKATNDSLYNRDKSSAIESLTFEQNLKEQERQTELQKQAEERNHNIQLAITAIGILSAVILFLLLSRSVLVSHKIVAFLSVLVLLVVFEFINLLIHPFLEKITHHSPILMLLCLVAIAALIIPLHHKLEHWTTKKLVEKNKAIRLAQAKKTIEELEEKKDV